MGRDAGAKAGLFIDASERAGLDFEHVNGMQGQLTIIEIMGPGAGLFDADGDGDLDLLLPQGHPLVPGWKPQANDTAHPRFYRNQLRESGELRFVDASVEAGFSQSAGHGYGVGVATGDVDGDGHVDLLITHHGPDVLWRNRGDGTFEPRTLPGTDGWSTGATFADLDRDGDLDLFVVGYIEQNLDTLRPCRSESGALDYCRPTLWPPVQDRLYRNDGDGGFEDVTAEVGMDVRAGGTTGAGLGVIAADLDDDGRLDLYVANDGMANQLWHQQDDGTFDDLGALSGTAFNREGKAEAGMGVDAQDYDLDGDLDLFVTHLAGETNTLYVNAGDLLFDDRTPASGLGPPSLPFTSFGTRWLDVDFDNRLDLLVVSGEVRHLQAQREAGIELPLRQPSQLFVQARTNSGEPRYRDATTDGGLPLGEPRVYRAAAFGDLDDDGDTDAVVTVNNGAARVWLRAGSPRGPWTGLRLIEGISIKGAIVERDLLGAEVWVVLDDGTTLRRRAHSDGSYLAAHDPRILVVGRVEYAEVHWPDDRASLPRKEIFSGLEPNRYHALRRGAGEPASE